MTFSTRYGTVILLYCTLIQNVAIFRFDMHAICALQRVPKYMHLGIALHVNKNVSTPKTDILSLVDSTFYLLLHIVYIL